MQQNKTQQNRRNKRTNNSHRAIIVWKQTSKQREHFESKPTCKFKQGKIS